MSDYLNSNFDLSSEQLVDVLDEVPVWSAPFGMKLLELVRLKKNIMALDIGFGTGYPLTELAMRLGKTCKVIGIDPWEAAIKRTEKKLALYGITNAGLIRGVAEDIPLDSHSIDLITSNNGLNNVADLRKSLSECSRVLKTGGQFIQTMNLDTSFEEFYKIMVEVLREQNMETELRRLREHIYKKRKPLDEYNHNLVYSGFSVDRILYDKFEYSFVDGTTLLNHFFIRLAFLDGWKSFLPEERVTGVFRMVEGIMNDRAEAEGFIRLSVPFVVIDCHKV